MYSFRNDYSEGVHPKILKSLEEGNLLQADGYGEDPFTTEAIKLIKEKLEHDSDIHLIAGGTLTNRVAISAFLKPHHAVISPDSGHIFTHETGAIEATGHKVIPVKGNNGKLNISLVDKEVKEHHFEHMVKPALVYISQPTEFGTLYSKEELEDLYNYCKDNTLFLYIDGARLANALASENSDLTLKDYAKLSDSFYIGGTKNGGMFGEALVINNPNLKADFRYHLKQKGALLAKGRFIGVQFKEFFKDELYTELGKVANNKANMLQSGIKELGFKLLFESHTNQIFPIFPESILVELEKKYLFYRWGEVINGECPVRLVCSWTTTDLGVDNFLADLKGML